MKLSSLLLSSLLVIPSVTAFPFEPIKVLQLGEDEIISVKESDKWSLLRRGIKFIDITKYHNKEAKLSLPFLNKKPSETVVPVYEYPTNVTHSKLVNSITSQIDKGSMHENLSKLTSFFTRYYKSETGFQSAQWLSTKINEIMSKLPEDKYSIEHIDHKDWKQFSIIVRIHGSETPESIVVMGSHQDSINLLLPSILPAPGADDNGSGTVTNLEALRLYVEHYLSEGNAPLNTIEFHFYSAEEGGLLGSLDVFTQYAALEKKVVAMLQQDMTGYVMDPEDEHVGVITDYTTPGLTDFIKLIIDSYLAIPYVETTCGYACSDHGSATKNGFPASFVIEGEFKKTNKYIHSTMDTLDRLSFNHMAEHVKIVVGSIIELGDWKFTTHV
ncbi:putative aminopeptidase NDAI_0A04120 [Naumovozyma dairenensis CBS 421]|uniref:Peptide hydrolase n=1 Tax=Naumovozyma dairenensis (strain ATCC 10597 / BCRC 20456 / CBS 421 / NBRC 0211 / NRRL Y-12639) TaxID=1071378 RepID=G0W431_NAUDC|nr:hypothetical protein NDAI_0A04120 [Naumovozyma dairenensis CBS 421]CCD22569.1 hypothetical protein NDAI_0A04120 [Naumovozyma dairenensis CBS 421]